jgi:hypothetical protein
MMEIFFKGKKQVFADFDGFTIKTDQQVKSGGDAEFPEPFSLFFHWVHAPEFMFEVFVINEGYQQIKLN